MKQSLIKTTLNGISVLSFLFISAALSSCAKKQINKVDLVNINGILCKYGTITPFTGREKASLQNRIIEYDVVKGVRNGEFKILYSEGKPQIVGQMVNNKNEGLWKYYYENSQIESEGNFKNDIPDDTWIWFYLDGKIREKGNYVSGKRDGRWITYNESGKISDEKQFKVGELIDLKKNQ
jgi:antitoxin component YwqK of YwqJK toxin-antitoxin module